MVYHTVPTICHLSLAKLGIEVSDLCNFILNLFTQGYNSIQNNCFSMNPATQNENYLIKKCFLSPINLQNNILRKWKRKQKV